MRITITMEAPVYGGMSIGRWEGKVIFVRGGLPGETVEARLDEDKGDYFRATALSIHTPSPQRIEPSCPYFLRCGGCDLQFLSPPGQITLKERVLKDCLRRIGGLEISLLPSLTAVSPWHYRLRGQFKVSGAKVGLYGKGSRDVVDITTCPLMTDDVNRGLAVARSIIINSYNVSALFAPISEVHVTAGGGMTALLKTSVPLVSKGKAQALAAPFLEGGFTGVTIEDREKRTRHAGQPRVALNLGGLTYTVSPLSFLQSNWQLNQVVSNLVRQALQPLDGQTVVDLFAGAGNLSLPLCDGASQVIAVEGNPHAVHDGMRNSALNGIANCRFVRSTAEEGRFGKHVHVVIIDPPRGGLTKGSLDRILSMFPRRIVYLSCNPTTLSRDLKKLKRRYALESLRLVDFFPQTYHIETLAFLQAL